MRSASSPFFLIHLFLLNLHIFLDGLDYKFFNKWGVYSVRAKGKNVIKKGEIEIMARSNPEFSRGHIKYELNPEDVYKDQFRITKENKNGIFVNVKGMKVRKYLRY